VRLSADDGIGFFKQGAVDELELELEPVQAIMTQKPLL
jgi:hypothetical protein